MAIKLSYRLLVPFFFLTLLAFNGKAQEKSDRQRNFTRDSIPELDLNPDTTIKANKKKKKVKKNIFYGKKCRKGFTRKGKREKQVLETFWYLKKFELPDPYIKDIYVFDPKERKILEKDEITEADKGKYKILHGPYKRTVGGDPVEMGIFYAGMKHGRWEKFGKNFILLDKIRFYRGWQRDAEITYFDNDRKKVREVMPYKYKSLNGSYYLFSETGQVLIHGKYLDDQKVGMWVEYFAETGKRKRETSYPKDIYKGEQFKPFVANEWDEKGTPIIKDGKPFDPNAKVKKTGRNQTQRPPAKKKVAPLVTEEKKEPKSKEESTGKKSESAPPLDKSNEPAVAPKDSTESPRKPTKEEIKKRLEKKMR